MTFRELVAADVLVMSKSSFSYVAAILNEGTVIYDRYARAPLPIWVERNANAGVNTKQLRERLIAQFLPEMRSARPRWKPSIALG
jgi:hypothetical protein